MWNWLAIAFFQFLQLFSLVYQLLRLPNKLSSSQVWLAYLLKFRQDQQSADTCWTYIEKVENKNIKWNLRCSICWISQHVRPWDEYMYMWDVHWGDNEGGKISPLWDQHYYTVSELVQCNSGLAVYLFTSYPQITQ